MTANAFSSVSLDPPLILVCVISPSEGADHITPQRRVRGQHPGPGSGAAVALLRLARPATWEGRIRGSAAPVRGQRLADPRGLGGVPGLPPARHPRGGRPPDLHRRGARDRDARGRHAARVPRRRLPAAARPRPAPDRPERSGRRCGAPGVAVELELQRVRAVVDRDRRRAGGEVDVEPQREAGRAGLGACPRFEARVGGPRRRRRRRPVRTRSCARSARRATSGVAWLADGVAAAGFTQE